MERLFPSKSGFPTVSCRGTLLHSSYDPYKEARKYIDSCSIPPKTEIVLVIGSCLGYLEAVLSSLYPQIKILSIQFSSYYRGKEKHSLPEIQRWYPDSSRSLKEFLYSQIEERSFPYLSVLEWKPAYQVYPEQAREIAAAVTQFSREMSGTIQTTYAFGRKWLLNSIKNFIYHPLSMRIRSIDAPICITASGPSLQKALPYLSRFRDRFSLWALPSALPALLHSRILPDLVVLTDAGYYASYHLNPYLWMRKDGIPLLIAQPLTAAFIPPSFPIQPIFFQQGTEIEKSLNSFLPYPLDYVPSNGTVAGSALELALRTTTSSVFFLGLDLCIEGIQEHVYPNAFDTLPFIHTTRFTGFLTHFVQRSIDFYPERISYSLRTSPALRTYAGWFKTLEHRWKNRVYRISPTPIDIGIPEISWKSIEMLPPSKTACFVYTQPSLTRENRRKIILQFLKEIVETLETEYPEGRFPFLSGFRSNKIQKTTQQEFLEHLKKRIGEAF
jgi:hypothetical protein